MNGSQAPLRTALQRVAKVLSGPRRPAHPAAPVALSEREGLPPPRDSPEDVRHTGDRLPAAPSGRRVLLSQGALALSGWPALALTSLPGGSPLRWVPVLLFVTFGPGLALLLPQPGALRPAARLEALALAAPISLSLATLTATALFLVEGFSATAFLLSLALFCTVVALLPGIPLPAATRGAAERVKPSLGKGR